MARKKVFEKHGIEFPWIVKLSRNSKSYSSLDEWIRQCKEDAVAVSDDAANGKYVKLLEKIVTEDDDAFLFVHDSQMMFYPIFCLVIDIATPEEQSILEETVLAVSQKFKHFQTKRLEKKFLKILYSKKNKEKAGKFGLEFRNIGSYYY